MNKFSIIVENTKSKKYYKISSEVDLTIEAESEGEAGYTSDSILSSIEHHSDFRITDIMEISKDEFMCLKVIESIDNEELTVEQKIMSEWNTEFGEREPTTVEKFEFYRKMRDKKIDADIVIDTLKKNNLI